MGLDRLKLYVYHISLKMKSETNTQLPLIFILYYCIKDAPQDLSIVQPLSHNVPNPKSPIFNPALQHV